MAQFNQLMLDLETLDTTPTSVIVSIGAVKFNFDNDQISEFGVVVEPRSCKELGMTISQETLDWWREQRPEAVKAWLNKGIPAHDAATAFMEFLNAGDCKPRQLVVWAHGIDFDLPIIKNFLKLCGFDVPWKYVHQMDTRTVFTLARFDNQKAERDGTYHDAVSDCRNQIKWVKGIVNGGTGN